jgi:hypothetical protein
MLGFCWTFRLAVVSRPHSLEIDMSDKFLSQSRQLLAVSSLGFAALVAPVGAQATTIVYDALSGAAAHPIYDANNNFKAYNYYYQCFGACTDPVTPAVTSEPLKAIGDHVSLSANSGRALTGFDFGVVQGAGSAAVDFSVTLAIFSSPTTLVAAQTSGNIHLGAAGTNAGQTGYGSIVQLDLRNNGNPAFNLPDTFYYSVILNIAGGGAAPSNFGLWLWDYYQDGTPGLIPVGTDIGNTGTVANGDFTTTVWGSTATSAAAAGAAGVYELTSDLGANNNAGLANGFTPAVRFSTLTPVAVVPEPASYLLLIAGLAAVGITRRRRTATAA